MMTSSALHWARGVTPSPLSPLIQVAEEPEVPLAYPVSVKRKKLVGNLSYPCICVPFNGSLMTIPFCMTVRTHAHQPTVRQVEAQTAEVVRQLVEALATATKSVVE